MRILSICSVLIATAITITPGSSLAQSVGQDMKSAGSATKDAAKDTGHAADTVGKKTASGTTRAYHKTTTATSHMAHSTAKGTKKAAVKTSDVTKTGYHKTVSETKKAGDKVSGKPDASAK
jgi:predicted small secreted protein